jgi:DNA repair protein RadC
MSDTLLQKLFAVSEIEIMYRNKVAQANRLRVKTSENAFDIFYHNWDMDKIDLYEEFKVIFLDSAAACLGLAHLSKGGVMCCVADPRLIFAMALKARAVGMIVAHNHPSGNLNPSKADLALTQRLVDAGKLLDIKVCDHLILGDHDYISLGDEGLMPSPRL